MYYAMLALLCLLFMAAGISIGIRWAESRWNRRVYTEHCPIFVKQEKCGWKPFALSHCSDVPCKSGRLNILPPPSPPVAEE
jgi:hypothetical protein